MKSIRQKKTMAMALALSSTLMLGGIGAAQAQAMGGNMYGGCATNAESCQGRFANLTDAQKTARQQAFEDFKTRTETIRTQLNTKREEYRNLLNTTTPNEAQIRTVNNEIHQLHSQLSQEKVTLDIELAKQGIPAGMRGHGMRGMKGMFNKGRNSNW